MRHVVGSLISLLVTSSLMAQAITPKRISDEFPDAVVPCQKAAFHATARLLTDDEAKTAKKYAEQFADWGFGAGIGANVSLDDHTRIKDAQVIGGKITVTEDEDATAGPVLELHKFTWTLKSAQLIKIGDQRVVTRSNSNCTVASERIPLVGTGPFAVIRIGSNDVFQSIGAGLLFGFRTEQSDKSLNLGVAYTLDLHVRELADGFEEGEPLPTGENEIRYRETSQSGIIVLLSVGW